MAAAAPKEWQRYTNPVLGVSIEYPKEWGFEESPAVGIVVFMDSEVLKAQSTENCSCGNKQKGEI